jgi:hypothetical protein
MTGLFSVLGFGLITAAIIGISAVALSLQYGVTNFANLNNQYHNVFGPVIAVQATGVGDNYQTIATLSGSELQKATP